LFYSFAQQTVPDGLLKCLFPGPVTVVFNRSPELPTDFNPGVSSVGLRIPQARIVRDLCRMLPYEKIAQTSANLSGTDKNPICIEVGKLNIY
jgi:tRNA A37 threonylcarbamoyladenosine synthetase subunit TsaC/SUA5/YrdC